MGSAHFAGARVAAVLGLATAAALARAAPLDGAWAWCDGQGELHAAARPEAAPEPYGGAYRAGMRLPDAASAVGGAAPLLPLPQPPPDIHSGAEQAAQRALWQGYVRNWRQELLRATAALQALQEQLDAVGLNPVLREAPGARAQREVLVAARQPARARVLAARQVLLETLPARARAAHVPPAWLR